MNVRLHLALCECAVVIARHTSPLHHFRVTTGDIKGPVVDVRIEFIHGYHGAILRILSATVDTSMPTSLRLSILNGFEKQIEQYVSEHQTR